jgi:hypothetical protein
MKRLKEKEVVVIASTWNNAVGLMRFLLVFFHWDKVLNAL